MYAALSLPRTTGFNMALESMVTFTPKKNGEKIKTSRPPKVPGPAGASQKDLKKTEVYKAMASVPRKNLIYHLEN